MLKVAIYKGVNRYSLSGGYSSSFLDAYTTAPSIIEFQADSIEISRSIVELTTFKITTSLGSFDFINDFPIVKNMNYYVEVEYNGVVVANGLLYETNIDLSSGEVTFDCNDMLYLLNYSPAVPNVIVNNKSALAGVFSILSSLPSLVPVATTGNSHTAYWEISRFFSLFSRASATRVDLRDEKTTLAQLQKIAMSVPKFYFRYGGAKIELLGMSSFAITHSLECGVFDDSTGMQYNEKNIDEFNIRIPNEPKLVGLFSYGGEYKTGTPATTPQIVLSSDKSTYGEVISPYIINVPFNFVYDSTVTNFDTDVRFLTAYYKEVQPDTLENPSATEKQQAGDSVYQRASNELKEGQVDTEIEISSKEFPLNVMPGNTVQLSYRFYTNKYDQINNKVKTQEIPGFSLDNTTYYIKSYTMNISQEEKSISYQLQSDNNFVRDSSQERILVSLGRQLRESGEFYTVTSPMHNIGYYNYLVSSSAPNHTEFGYDWYRFVTSKMSDLYLGDIRPIPTGASPVVYYGIDLAGGSVKHTSAADFHIEQFYKDPDSLVVSGTNYGIQQVNNGKYYVTFRVVPSTAAANFEVMVRRNGGSWTSSDFVNFKVIVVFEV